MSQPYNRVYNFSAGPCTLPVEVLEQVRDELLNWNGSGMSVMELSHRSMHFGSIIEETEADFRSLLGIPESYHVLFLQGGASLQNTMIPMSLLPEGGSADYVVTGSWGQKSAEAARRVGQIQVLWDGKAHNYDRTPEPAALQTTPGAAYVHYTSNETIQGVQFFEDLAFSVPAVCDMSSDILSRPIDISRYNLIYAGAQKNMGPAGATVVVISQDLLDRCPKDHHPMLDYRLHTANASLYNTPPCFAIYVCGLVYKWVVRQGGVARMQEQAQAKSQLLYDAIDSSGGFYSGHSQKHCRSVMNVTFTLPNEELTNAFVKESEALGLDGLKGHRSVGGIRASIYNAFPKEGCEALADFMGAFARRNG
ncbi:MAG: 3-phosphoserine/phosphohydroxythreonine transaminase [Fimbriimonadaceae bacterium]|nr:3-phosphoserine/phosphohydroxythreonine transaminase [Fimbriimonadaceae bacterium]